MPTYDYKCQDCEHTFERFQSITADPLTECPECNGRVKRLIGAGGGLLFKGSGFYITDYRSDGYSKKAKSEGGSSPSSSSASSSSASSSSASSSSAPSNGGGCGKAGCGQTSGGSCASGS